MADGSDPIRATPKSKVLAAFDWREWGKLLFGQVKLPTIVLVVWGLFTLIPTLNGAVRFWWDAAIYLGGKMGLVGTILTSPWFGLLLIISGIAYQLLVDETKRPALRQKAFLFLGWLVAAFLLLAIFVVSIVSYINAAIGPRHLYPLQRETITRVLKEHANQSNPIEVHVVYVGSCYDCDGYAFDFQDVISQVSGWGAPNAGTVLGPSRFSISPFGVALHVANPDHLSEGAQWIAEALRRAGIRFDVRPGVNNIWPTDVEILISPRERR